MSKCSECDATFKAKTKQQMTCLSEKCKYSRNHRMVKEHRARLKAAARPVSEPTPVEICNRFLLRRVT